MSNTVIVRFDEIKYFIGLSDIVAYAFARCENLKSIRIPVNVKVIRLQAFWRDTRWDLLDLPSGLTNLLTGNVRLLSVLVCRAENPPAFSNNYYSNSTKLYVPRESVEAYKADPKWSVYTDINPIEGSEYED